MLFQDPVLRYGWRTGAIIPELEVCCCMLLPLQFLSIKYVSVVREKGCLFVGFFQIFTNHALSNMIILSYYLFHDCEKKYNSVLFEFIKEPGGKTQLFMTYLLLVLVLVSDGLYNSYWMKQLYEKKGWCWEK